ncbi:MAG: BolA family protein [Candidatus Polarisedimenticolia bacterium]
MTSSDTSSRIESTLRAAFSPTHLDIVDESHLHAGHAGARGGRGHFAVRIVSAAFEGKSPIERHRMVHAVLAEEMASSIHALALGTWAPQEWAGGAGARRISTLG